VVELAAIFKSRILLNGADGKHARGKRGARSRLRGKIYAASKAGFRGEVRVSYPIEKRIAGLCLGAALVCVAAVAPLRAQTSAGASPKKTPSARTVAAKSAPAKPSLENLTALKSEGSKSAPLTMEVFSDFECPACRALLQDTLRQITVNYVDTGKLYLIHRDFPLPMHKYSREAARYANAAALIGKFNVVYAALFSKQESWSVNGQVDAVVAGVLTPAEIARVRQSAKEKDLDAAIQKDVDLGTNVHRVTQTPTSVITYQGQTYPIVGVVSYPILKQFLDQLLKR
jgi:protein-disulfide isomerase